MKFFSGFSLSNESYLFKPYLNTSQYAICGFSYGAIKAFREAKESIASAKRVDILQLFSPAFFQTKPTKFKRIQTMSYAKNSELYLKNFTKLCFEPYEVKIIEHSKTTSEELNELLEYVWDIDELKELCKKGVKIEVYLGSSDKIIDVNGAREFFLEVATVTYIKDANHFLQTN